jgi:hypothetical protein
MYRTVALVVALTLGIAGCGGTDPKLTRAQLVTRLDEACAQARQATARGAAGGAQADRARFLAAYIAGQHVLLERIDGLNASDALQHDLDGFQKGMQQRLDLLEHVQSAVKSGDTAAIVASKRQQQTIFEALDVIAHRLELQGCV